MCHTTASNGSCFTAGKFLDTKTVLLQMKNGRVYLFGVPFSLEAPPQVRGELPMDLSELSVLGCQDDGARCHAVGVELDELTVAFGAGGGAIRLWRAQLASDDDVGVGGKGGLLR